MYMADLIKNIKEGQIARATFGGERWFVTQSSGFIRYYDLTSETAGDIIQLTASNIMAHYEIITAFMEER